MPISNICGLSTQMNLFGLFDISACLWWIYRIYIALQCPWIQACETEKCMLVHAAVSKKNYHLPHLTASLSPNICKLHERTAGIIRHTTCANSRGGGTREKLAVRSGPPEATLITCTRHWWKARNHNAATRCSHTSHSGWRPLQLGWRPSLLGSHRILASKLHAM